MDIFKNIVKSGSDAASRLTRDKAVQAWLDELDSAVEREKSWRKEAQRVLEVYEMQAGADASTNGGSAFNILYANTETLSPAVYNNTPRPVVKRKTDRQNSTAIAAAQVIKAVLTYLANTTDSRYTSFDELQKLAVQEALVPGRGLARFSYDAYIEGGAPDTPGVLKEETICGDPVPWNRVVYGYAKQWANVPWMAYEHFMTREECKANFGAALGAKLKLTHAPSDDKDTSEASPADAEGVKFAHLWEIWDKRSRKVIWVSEGHPSIVKEESDPLKLEGFFCAPRPVSFLNRISSLVPQTLYLMYEEQAKELEDVTRRIGHLTRAMKIRGFYDATMEGLEDLLRQPENTILPTRNVAALAQGQTLEKSIWLMPIAELIQVLRELYLNRQQIISVIHQITGVADIMRGASAASETLGAQKMKEAWGTMRLKRMQKEVQRFARDCFRLQAELASKHFGVDTLKALSGLQFPSMGEKQMAQMQMAQMQMQMAQTQMQAPGQPPAPEMQQQLQTIQSTLETPSWEEIQAFLRDDDIRNYRIDVETNTTVDIEATEDKAEMAEMMNSMAQLLNGVLPMVKEGILPFQAAKSLLLTVVSKFRLGDEVEETFRNMQEPKPQADPAQQKVEAEMKRDEQSHQMDMEAKKQELEQKKELEALKLQIERQKLELQRQALVMEAEAARAKHQQQMETIMMKAALPPAAQKPAPGAQNADA